MSHTREEKLAALGRVIDTLDILRVKCPWDAKQTNESLRSNTIEETFELCQALMNEDNNEIRKELGDVLLHILFYSKIGDEKSAFDIADVADALNDKLIFRHPHIFGNVKADTAEQVKENWEALKLKEKGGNRTILAGVPAALPALIKAFRIQEKAADSGFDWEKREDVWNKVREEASEVHTEIERGNADRIEAEFGDLLFAVVNAARLYGVNPENALERTNRKFIHRFNHIEACAKARNRSLRDMTLAEMDVFWNEAKASESTPASDPEA
ncbi:MAG: nucleoside triphosphate pyrophosphohydrolase [Bacteroidales bacterium]|nr:nucleoside triphosphate pyrophosphohydrolase [Bacteroidales bacterium]MDY2916945.1 nucleoside triphosphate pyrophosphohydrolase [Muribaculaceae bacterium]